MMKETMNLKEQEGLYRMIWSGERREKAKNCSLKESNKGDNK